MNCSHVSIHYIFTYMQVFVLHTAFTKCQELGNASMRRILRRIVLTELIIIVIER